MNLHCSSVVINLLLTQKKSADNRAFLNYLGILCTTSLQRESLLLLAIGYLNNCSLSKSLLTLRHQLYRNNVFDLCFLGILIIFYAY